MKSLTTLFVIGLTALLTACGGGGGSSKSSQTIPPPELKEITALGTVNTLAPEYRFSTTLAGSIQYAGSCTADATQAKAGDNTVTFENLEWWKAYNDCAITVTAENGKVSAALQVSSFDVIPTPKEVAPIGVSDTNTPKYTFSIEAPGKIQYTGSCTSDDAQAKAGNNTITFKNLEWWKTHDDCALIITSEDGKKTSSTLIVSSFNVVPKPVELAPITVTNTLETEYKFHSDITGTIQSTGSCAFDPISVQVGENSITFKNLEWWKTYSNCAIAVTAENGKVSTALQVSSFDVIPRPIELAPITVANALETEYKFYSDITGTIQSTGSCAFDPISVQVGENSITFKNLEWWKTYSDCAITVAAAAENGKVSHPLEVTPFKVLPTLENNDTRSYSDINSVLLGYIFNSGFTGSAEFSGDCGSKTQPIKVGQNVLEFDPLKWWLTYENCAITITSDAPSFAHTYEIDTFRTVYPAKHPLADTGMDLCANFPSDLSVPDSDGNFKEFKVDFDCAALGVTQTDSNTNGGFIIPAGQDATHGRDAQALAGTLKKKGSGHAGYDFTKLNEKGEELPDDAEEYACIKDNFTQLIWEVKNNKPRFDDLHSGKAMYYWYNPDPNTNGGFAGYEDNDTNQQYCSNKRRCDTEKFIEDVNTENDGKGYCGLTNWRLPTYSEMVSIANVRSSVQKKLNSIENPILKDAYSFNLTSSFVKKDSNHYLLASIALYLYFPAYIQPLKMQKDPFGVVLVSQPAAYQQPLNNDEKYEDFTDKTVLDKNTGLIWTRCPVESDGSNVDSVCNSNKTYYWDEALKLAQTANNNEFLGYSDWRLPSIQELTSLQAYDRIPMINQNVFPIDAVENKIFWSSTPSAYADSSQLQGIQTIGFRCCETPFSYPKKLGEEHYSLLVRGGY